MTFKEIYQKERSKDKGYPTPSRSFIKKMARLTKKTESTVKMWLYGDQTPDELSKSVISSHFNIPSSELFPKKAAS